MNVSRTAQMGRSVPVVVPLYHGTLDKGLITYVILHGHDAKARYGAG